MPKQLTSPQALKIYNLWFKEELKNYSEIARRVGCQRETVKSHILNAEMRAKELGAGRPRRVLEDELDSNSDESLKKVLEDVMAQSGYPAQRVAAVLASLKLRSLGHDEDPAAQPINEDEKALLLDLMKEHSAWLEKYATTGA